jgi:hypothetical protein
VSPRPSLKLKAKPGGETETRPGKKARPSLDQHLSRVLAALSPTPGDYEDDDPDEQETDEYEDAPEELEPVDEDEPEGEDHWGAPNRGLFPSIRFVPRTRPRLRGSYADLDEEEHSQSLAIIVASDPSEASGSELVGRLQGEQTLRAIGTALARLQRSAITARDMPSAYDALEPMTQRQLGKASGVTETVLSRRRNMLVEAPWGIVPLSFYCWKKAGGALSSGEATMLAQLVVAQPDASDLLIAREVAAAVCSPDDVAARADALRKHVPAMRVLVAFIPRLNTASHALALADIDELEANINEDITAAIGADLKKRGKGLVRYGLVGAYRAVVL